MGHSKIRPTNLNLQVLDNPKIDGSLKLKSKDKNRQNKKKKKLNFSNLNNNRVWS